MASCPRELDAPGGAVDLPARDIVEVDGRQLVPIDQANVRENLLLSGAIVFRGGWLACRSVVIYAEDRDAELRR